VTKLRAWLRVVGWLSSSRPLDDRAVPIEIPKPPMRWEQYGHGSRGRLLRVVVREEHHPVDRAVRRQPLILEPWQLEFMGEALAVDVDGDARCGSRSR
jgi:hypothetical protein